MAHRSRPARSGLTLWLLFMGMLFLTVGLIFLWASLQDSTRIPIALALVFLGGAAVAVAGIRWRRAGQMPSALLDERITDLAASRDGEASVALVMRALGVTEEVAHTALTRLEASGRCLEGHRQGKLVYVFPSLKDGGTMLRCPDCGTRYSIRKPRYPCPNCGGTLESARS